MHKVMFYIVWSALYAVSLLPKKALYALSDAGAFLLRLSGYRRSVIDVNMARSFPQLKYGEIVKLRKEYYRYMLDIALETVWTITASQRQIAGMIRVKNPELMDGLNARFPKIIVVMGHCGNWELFGGLTGAGSAYQKGYAANNFYISYKAAKSSVFNDVFVKIRTDNFKKATNAGGILESRRIVRHILADRSAKGIYYFIADQSPKQDRIVVDFLHQPTLMFGGAEYLSSKLGLPMVYMDFGRIARGKYEITFRLVSDDPQNAPKGELTRKFAHFLQQDIEGNKVNWLWSHKRWKKTLTPEEMEEYDKIYRYEKD